MELDKIIKRIEDEHITMIESSPKEQQHREKEDDDNFFEVAYSAKSVRDINKTNDTLRQSNCHDEHQSIDTKDTSSYIKQGHLKGIKKEIDMLHEININKESVNFYLKQEDTFNENTIMLEIEK